MLQWLLLEFLCEGNTLEQTLIYKDTVLWPAVLCRTLEEGDKGSPWVRHAGPPSGSIRICSLLFCSPQLLTSGSHRVPGVPMKPTRGWQ